MPNRNYLAVRRLPISVIADEWYRERTLGLPRRVIAAELRRSLVNMDPLWNWQENGLVQIGDLPPLEDLPPEETELDINHLRTFCRKQRWPLPRFWFPDEAPPPRRRGRPSNKSATVQQFIQWLEEGRTWHSQIDAARDLENWQRGNPDLEAKIDKASTISGWLKGHFDR